MKVSPKTERDETVSKVHMDMRDRLAAAAADLTLRDIAELTDTNPETTRR